MRRRFLCIAALALAALFALASVPLPAAQPPRILAVGDLHGDYSAWLDIARAAGIVNAQNHWAAGNATLVQMGDITDRGPDSLKIIHSLQQLQREAPRSGGRVVVILGNHEAMNLLGDNRYTTAGEYAAFADGGSAARRDRVYDENRPRIEAAARAANPALTPQQIRDSWNVQHPLGWVEHRIAWSPSGELGQWTARNPAVAKIDGTLFAHGGLSAEYTRLSLIDINRKVAAAMAAADESPASILTDPLGPLWYRGLAGPDTDAEALRAAARPPAPHLSVDQELDAVLSAYGAQRLVIAHTPDLKGIQILGRGRLARIDTGISRYYGGPLTWLEIVGGKMIPHTTQRSVP
ncbi:MAG TPA: metallophosphoesterase [Sphingomicrobium sp.]